MKETHARTVARVATWRVWAIALASTLGLIATGSWTKGVQLGIAYNLIQIVAQFSFERLWSFVSWGMIQEAPIADVVGEALRKERGEIARALEAKARAVEAGAGAQALFQAATEVRNRT